MRRARRELGCAQRAGLQRKLVFLCSNTVKRSFVVWSGYAETERKFRSRSATVLAKLSKHKTKKFVQLWAEYVQATHWMRGYMSRVLLQKRRRCLGKSVLRGWWQFVWCRAVEEVSHP